MIRSLSSSPASLSQILPDSIHMKVSEINIYPIKSLRGISLESATVEKRGLRFDRRWMLTDRNGIFFTQRELPRMATVRISLNGDRLTAAADGAEDLHVPLNPEVKLRQHVTVWQSEVEAIVYDRHANEWFSEVLKRECRLVRMPETSERHVSADFDSGNDLVSFADGYPLLLTTEASLEELNRKIEVFEDKDHGHRKAVPMNRFRPSVVVKGSEPFAEDKWARIKIGETVFRVVKPCGRCVITTTDQEKGEVAGKEPLRTLASFRKAIDVRPTGYEMYGHGPNSLLFGENLIPENPGGVISVGDKVKVIELRDEYQETPATEIDISETS